MASRSAFSGFREGIFGTDDGDQLLNRLRAVFLYPYAKGGVYVRILLLLLALESMLVLIGLILKMDVWIVIVCYWASVVVKNAADYIIDDPSKNDRRR